MFQRSPPLLGLSTAAPYLDLHGMHYVLSSIDPLSRYLARIEYRDSDPFRMWNTGEAFSYPPDALPLEVTVVSDSKTEWAEMWEVSLPLMSRRMLQVLWGLGLGAALQTYPAVLHDAYLKKHSEDYCAFNVCRSASFASLPDTETPLLLRAQEGSSQLIINEPVRHALARLRSPSLAFYPLDPEVLGVPLA